MSMNAQSCHYDVLVVGAGPSGVAAAISAARNGANTLLVEKDGFLGGMSTAGLLNIWCGHATSGLYTEIREKTTIRRGSRHVYDPELLKLLYQRLLTDSGASLLLHSPLLDCTVDAHGISSITVLGKTSSIPLTADVYIDATGDGDLAYHAQVPFQLGRESDGRMQPVSLEFSVGGVDETKAVYPTFGTHPDLEALMEKEVAEGRIPAPAGHVILIEGYHPGTAWVNMTNCIRTDGTNAWEMTEAEILTRRQIEGILSFLQRHVPGYENCFLLQTAVYAGVRETRHFEGRYRLTEHDIASNTIFEDWVVADAVAGFGNHSLVGSGPDANNLPYNGKPYTIPYRCLLPKDVQNLLLCGRCISGTHMAHASYRLMPICMAMGQAAVAAAALCTQNRWSPCALPVGQLQELLLQQGYPRPSHAV